MPHLILEQPFVLLKDLLSCLVLVLVVSLNYILRELILGLPELLKVTMHELVFHFLFPLKLLSFRLIEHGLQFADRILDSRLRKPIFNTRLALLVLLFLGLVLLEHDRELVARYDFAFGFRILVAHLIGSHHELLK